MKKIRITLLKDGSQRLEVFGATGDECLRFTRDLETRLGTMEGERALKPEYDGVSEAAGAEHEEERS